MAAAAADALAVARARREAWRRRLPFFFSFACRTREVAAAAVVGARAQGREEKKRKKRVEEKITTLTPSRKNLFLLSLLLEGTFHCFSCLSRYFSVARGISEYRGCGCECARERTTAGIDGASKSGDRSRRSSSSRVDHFSRPVAALFSRDFGCVLRRDGLSSS